MLAAAVALSLLAGPAPATDEAASPSVPAPTDDASAPDPAPSAEDADAGADSGSEPADPSVPPDAAGGGDVPPMPPIEELPSREAPVSESAASNGPSETPPMPPIEELPSREAATTETPPMPAVEDVPPKKRRRGLFDINPPDPDRAPAGTEGGSFFDPAKLERTGPSGGAIQIRGFVSASFNVSERSNLQVREDDGTFERLSPVPFFDVNSATLYIGAPVYADVVYARIGLEYLSLPQRQISPATPDIIAQANRRLFFESAALEINPFNWAKKTKDWFRLGFKLTAGVFIVPFGLEDEGHAAPANWFASRPRSFSTNRVYPGTWSDVGVMLKWKPRFRDDNPIRPIEIDVGVINGDACTQTRFLDSLYQASGIVAPCSRRRRPGEVEAATADDDDGGVRIDSGFFGISPDNNRNKTFVARTRAYPLPAINFGASFLIGKHPDTSRLPDPGETTADLGQGLTYRVGGHVDVDFDDIFDTRYPLPAFRGEVVYGVDAAVDEATNADRAMIGGYAQIAQPLFRRKKTRLDGLIVQYRFDHADPDLAVPGRVGGVPLASDFANVTYPGESTLAGHTVGLRMPVLPRFMLKTEYTFFLEDGGETNRLANNLYILQAVADF